LSLDDLQRLTKETKLLQQEFQVVCDMESKSFEASSTFITYQKIKQWLDQRNKEFYIEKYSN